MGQVSLVAEEIERSTGKQLTPFERETVIRWDESDDQNVEFYTASKRVANRLLRAGVKPVKEEDQNWWFSLPKYCIRIKPGKRAVNITGKTARK